MGQTHITTPGRVLAVLGPTNTGKTHYAIERMMGYSSGMIGLPLRLLAREVYDRIRGIKGDEAVALITGEEKIVPKAPNYWVTTVESMPLDVSVECVAVDEIQLAGDPDRGHIFTDRLLRARGLSETLFLGSDTMRPLIAKLVPGIQFLSRHRFSDLAYTGARKLTRLPRRTAIVAFSANSVYAIAELVRRQRGGAAVVLGALSPRTRNAQVQLYESGEVDFMVATDAIGMGLNMDVDHVAFAETEKFDGTVRRPLRPAELAQIAGRAGRHMNDGTFGVTGDAVPFDGEVVEAIENHRFDPVRVAQWRNPDLDFTSLAHLNASLEALPPMRGLARARAADDVAALKLVTELPLVKDAATGGAALKQLWEVCQIPDFRKVTIDEHAQLLTNIYLHLMSHEGVLPDDWMEGHIARLDNPEGEIDMIASRIAHVRTWTYVANRSGWLKDPEHWRERARAVEDRLSDALHEKLTLRFIDRRTSVLIRRLREDEEFSANIDEEGEVLIEGEYVGRLQGFSFVADPRALGVHGKAIRAATIKGLSSEIADRAHRLSIAPEAAISLSEHGRLWWNGGIVGRLAKGPEPLSPRVEMLADDLLSTTMRERALYRLQGWVNGHIDKVLAPLMALQKALQEPVTPDVSLAEKTLEQALAPERDAQSGAEPRVDMPEPVVGDAPPVGTSEAVPMSASETAETTNSELDAEAEAEDEATTSDLNADDMEAATHAAESPEVETAAELGGASESAQEPQTERSPTQSAGTARRPAEPRGLGGPARGLAFQLIENLGAVSRAKAGALLKGLSQDARGPLRKLGVRFGQYTIFVPALIKPQAAKLKALLWAVHQGLADVPPAPQAGLTSVTVDETMPGPFLEAAGYRICGQRAVRIDMLERLADLIRAKGESGKPPEAFEQSGDMMSILGAGPEELAAVLRGLGFRDQVTQKEDGSSVTIWRARVFNRDKRGQERAQNGRGEQRDGGRHRRGGTPHGTGPRRGPSQPGQESGATAVSADAATPRPERGPRPDRFKGPRQDDRKGRDGQDRPRTDREHTRSSEKDVRAVEGRSADSQTPSRPKFDRPRSDGPRPDKSGRREEPKVYTTEKPKGSKGSRPVDPDSPFAVLAQLKFKS